ncbi:hypothetical protein [Nostoc sp.]|uniref:hypothetical protein n=1 Tax=Nostoc sp. TaxID=1180 RepID=UPI002FF3640A
MSDLKTPNCTNCGSPQVRYDSAFGFYKCETCSTVWGNDEDDPDYKEFEDKDIYENETPNDSVVLTKKLYVLNTLAMGVAIQILAKLTGESIEDWKEYVGAKAGEQYRELSAEKVQEIVEYLHNFITA